MLLSDYMAPITYCQKIWVTAVVGPERPSSQYEIAYGYYLPSVLSEAQTISDKSDNTV